MENLENEQIKQTSKYTNLFNVGDSNYHPFWVIVTNSSDEKTNVASLDLLTATSRVTRIWSDVNIVKIKNETRGYKMRRLSIKLTIIKSNYDSNVSKTFTLEPGQTVEFTVREVGDINFEILTQEVVYFTEPRKTFTSVYGNTYDIDLVMFTNLDSVTCSLFLPLLKKEYGEMDIIHNVRKNYFMDQRVYDSQLIKACNKPVILTCWDDNRASDALCDYCYDLDIDINKVRIYSLVTKFNFNKGNII